MTLRHLKIFIEVADASSMTAASVALHISQPTVSQAVSELEAHYGIRLFERLSKRLYITESGRQFLSYARHITTLFEEMDQTMKNSDQSGVLRVGASVTVGTYLLPQWIQRFNDEYHDIRIHAVVKNTTEIESLIIKSEIDFAVVEGNVHAAEIVTRPIMEDELVLVCGKTHPLYASKQLYASELKGQKFIVREQGSGTRELFENVMAAKGISWDILWDCSGSDGLKSAAISGLGIAVISARLVEQEVAAGHLHILKVSDLNLKRQFSIIYHKNKYLTKAMKAFFEQQKSVERN